MRPRLGRSPRPFTIGPSTVELSLGEGGVARIAARDEAGFARGLGFAHAHDRMLQMEMARLAGRGRLSECLEASDETTGVDLFLRHAGFAAAAEEQASALTGLAAELAAAYAEGVNARLSRGFPWELRLLGHRPSPWRPADSVLTLTLMSYVGLLQAQLDTEKLVVEALRGGVDPRKLSRLFRPHLDGLTPSLLALLRDLRVERPLLTPGLRFAAGLPSLAASNNWVVSGAHTASGFPLAAADPHLEVNRLPAIWYEVVGELPRDWRIGVTVPGLPGLVMGRSKNVSATFTYGFMDSADLFVEEVRSGAVRRESGFVPLRKRRETVLRKKGAPVERTFLESDAGTLETDGEGDGPADGLHLASAIASLRHGAQASLEALTGLWGAPDVEAARAAVARVSVSTNWLLAGRDGALAYQQGGLLPLRPSGLLPLLAWDPAQRWQGLASPRTLGRTTAAPAGFLATANDEGVVGGRLPGVTLSMGPYRASRIAELLSERIASGRKLTVDDLHEVQRDLVSTQARRLIPLLAPHLPATEAGALLDAWDLRYDAASRGATLFERVYRTVCEAVFGDGLFGQDAYRRVAAETLVAGFHFHLLDDVLVEETGEEWWGAGGRDAALARLVPAALSGAGAEVAAWGGTRPLVMRHLLFGGKLPSWLGFDRGPFAFPGGRATVVQGQATTLGGRPSTVAPSWRYATDLGSESVTTALAGGPSDRRFSRRYVTDLGRWLGGTHKTLKPGS